jgi:hypothetical protein
LRSHYLHPRSYGAYPHATPPPSQAAACRARSSILGRARRPASPGSCCRTSRDRCPSPLPCHCGRRRHRHAHQYHRTASSSPSLIPRRSPQCTQPTRKAGGIDQRPAARVVVAAIQRAGSEAVLPAVIDANRPKSEISERGGPTVDGARAVAQRVDLPLEDAGVDLAGEVVPAPPALLRASQALGAAAKQASRQWPWLASAVVSGWRLRMRTIGGRRARPLLADEAGRCRWACSSKGRRRGAARDGRRCAGHTVLCGAI